MSMVTQQLYKSLHEKTDMNAVKAFIAKNGIAAWRAVVKAQGMKLAKDATTQGIQTGLGLNFIDLRAPAFMLDPVFTPILNKTPRWDKVNAGYGVQPTWKAVTQIDASNQFPGLSEGNINAYGSFSEKNYSAPYVTLGTDDFVTYEGVSASEGYEDVLGDAKMWQLLRFRRQQERTYLGGTALNPGTGTPLQLGTTSTPTGVLTANGGNTNTTNFPVGYYAAAYCVALTYRAITNPNNTVANGLTTQYGRVSADGSATDVINGGTAIVSAVSNVVGPTVSGTKNVLFTATPMSGAWGYAWFVQKNASSFTPAPASALLTGITSASAFYYTGQTQGTQTAAYSGTGGYAGFSTDLSTNALDMDGILSIASNSSYTSNLPTWSFPTSSTSAWTVLPGGVDLHGAGLTNGGSVGTITEFDQMLYAIQSATLTSPTAIYLSTDQVAPFRSAFLVGATGSPQANFFFANGAKGEGGLEINTHVATYCNVFALDGKAFIPVIQHPYLPPGTILFDVDSLGEAYENSRMGETRGVFVRRDTYGIEFAQNTRKYPFGVFSEEVLAVKTPNILGFIKGAGQFGQTNLF